MSFLLSTTWIATESAKVFILSSVFGTLGLLVLRATYGSHPDGEDIVVVATPMAILFLIIRVLKTTLAPIPHAQMKTFRLGKRDKTILSILLALFGCAIILASSLVYKGMGIEWASTAARHITQRLFSLTSLASIVTIVATSEWFREQIRAALRLMVTVPDLCRYLIRSVVHRTLSHAKIM